MLDRLVDQMERGRPTVAAHQLVGMLDAVVVDRDSAARWQAALMEHPISEILLAGSQASCPGPCGALQATLETLDYHAAAALRQQLAREAISHARQRGQTILVLGETAQADEPPFDLVVGTVALGWVAPAALADWIGEQARQLAPGGQLLVSTFLPSHIGRGWRRLQAGAEPYSHDEDSIRAAAVMHGLVLRHFRDAANCIAWCQVIRPAPGDNQGGPSHDQ